MQISLKPKGKYKNYDIFHLEPEEKITTADLNGGELISPIYKDKSLALQELKEKLEILKQISCLHSRKIQRHCHACALREKLFKRLKNLS